MTPTAGPDSIMACGSLTLTLPDITPSAPLTSDPECGIDLRIMGISDLSHLSTGGKWSEVLTRLQAAQKISESSFPIVDLQETVEGKNGGPRAGQFHCFFEANSGDLRRYCAAAGFKEI